MKKLFLASFLLLSANISFASIEGLAECSGQNPKTKNIYAITFFEDSNDQNVAVAVINTNKQGNYFYDLTIKKIKGVLDFEITKASDGLVIRGKLAFKKKWDLKDVRFSSNNPDIANTSFLCFRNQ